MNFFKNKPKFISVFGILFPAMFAMQSCVNYKQQIMFQGLNDTTYKASMKQANPVIQRGDQLSIFVYKSGLDPNSAQVKSEWIADRAWISAKISPLAKKIEQDMRR